MWVLRRWREEKEEEEENEEEEEKEDVDEEEEEEAEGKKGMCYPCWQTIINSGIKQVCGQQYHESQPQHERLMTSEWSTQSSLTG